MTNHKRSSPSPVPGHRTGGVTAACGGDATPAADPPRDGASRAGHHQRAHLRRRRELRLRRGRREVERRAPEYPGQVLQPDRQVRGRRLPQLLQRLQAGSGAGDVVAIDEGIWAFKAPPAVLHRPRPVRPGRTARPTSPREVGRSASTPTASCSRLGTDVGWHGACATAGTCSRRPACPPTATRSRKLWPDLGRLRRGRQEVQGQGHRTPSGSTARNTLQHDPGAGGGRRTATSPTSTRATSSSSSPTRPSRTACDRCRRQRAPG